ncbi:thrombomodulin-like [Carcharodon carcharias]|uniref:thrombomodulin-like n=1 Tax=Carcharodon carcharias TaxID=13397 RepID=UPI001B7F1448|nr:thrombomodulin-like [Carcharodon carcharias]
MLFLRLCLSLLLSLGLSEGKTPQQELEETVPTVCVPTVCYSVQRQRRKFNMARNLCKSGGGDAMTVGSTVAAEAISVLLRSGGDTPLSQKFWIGLQLQQKSCPVNDSLLRGYRWVDGQTGSDYSKWGAASPACGPRCVTVSGSGAWADRPCNEKADGVLCEYRYPGSCRGIRPGNGTVTYSTPFGTNSSQLSELPPGTLAWVEPWGLRFQCSGDTWAWQPLGHPTPWRCQLENGGCQHKCEEALAGSPQCSCQPGYQLSRDGHSCQPFDLCQEAGCQHRCIVQEGSPYCLCRDGYQLDATGKGCVDVDECQQKPCEQRCVNSPGNFSCECLPGYQLTSDNKCNDINECITSPCAQKCANTDGSFQCYCGRGYETDPADPTMCVFYCQTNTEFCDARCTGDECYCPEGYLLDDRINKCQDVNECESGYCDGECTNTFGSYKCDCKESFELQEDGVHCESEGSGTVESLVTPPPSHPSRAGLSLGVVLGSIFAIAVLTLVLAGLGHHLLAKRSKWKASSAYKLANQDVDLRQVTSAEEHKCQPSEKLNVVT